MFALGLRQVQDALDRKADEIQREFVALSQRLDDLGRRMLEAEGEERKKLREEQVALRQMQHALAEEVNLWRDRSRAVRHQPGEGALRRFLQELLELGEPGVEAAIKYALYLMDAPPEELERLSRAEESREPQTPAGRLIERARSEYDLRSGEPATRRQAAVEFSNRPGVAQDDAILAEIEAAMEDEDPIVREVAALTAIQLHRFRALRFADLDAAHKSVKRLAQFTHPEVIPVLVEILQSPRTGYLRQGDETVESDNHRSRMVALLRLVEWHTPEAKRALEARRFDRDPLIAKAAQRALELFPDPWTGPLQKGEKTAARD